MNSETKAPQPPAEAQACGCGEATCVVPWEPGCGLGKSEQHAEAQPVALDYVPGKLDHTAPPRIWLQIDTSAYNSERWQPWSGAEGVSWYHESIGGLEIQYVRADLASPTSAPVGVERILAEMREEGQADIVDGGVVLEWEDDLRNALAQQPAADPGACPACNRAWSEHRIGYSASACKMRQPAAVDDVEGLKRLVRHLAGNPNFDFEAALAAQYQESKS